MLRYFETPWKKMFIMLIIATIITLSSLLVLQVKEVPAAENNPYYQENKTETCSVNSLLYSGPQCSPRPILISLPPGPLGQGVIEVIPAKVEVLRCGGVCHEDNIFHQCLPIVNRTKTIQVS